VRRVLFDEDLPRQLRRDLLEFTISTVQEEGWSAVQNGELLRHASATFDVLITADKNLQYQQNLARFNIGVVVIAAVDTRLHHLRQLLPQLRKAIVNVTPGSLIVVDTA
jgi:predicted nuclease of predicted toxin-antitoxin system